MRNSNKYRCDKFCAAGDSRGGVGSRTPISPPRKLIWAQTEMMGGFEHLRVITQNQLWSHNPVSIIKLVLLVIICSFLHLVMLKVVWVLEYQPSFLPKSWFFIDGGNFLSSWIRYYPDTSHSFFFCSVYIYIIDLIFKVINPHL